MRHRVPQLLLALILTATVTAPAWGSPADVIADYRGHANTITKKYSWADLRGAVTLAQSDWLGDSSFQIQLAEAVETAIARDYLGVSTPPDATLDPARVPSWVVALATATFILLGAGAAAAIWRHTRPLR